MELWTHTQVKPATLLVFLIGGALFIGAVVLKRLGQGRVEAGANGLPVRDWGSLGGVVLQAVGIGLAGGPSRGVGSGLLDGIGDLRTWLTAIATGSAAGLFFWAARTMGRTGRSSCGCAKGMSW